MIIYHPPCLMRNLQTRWCLAPGTITSTLLGLSTWPWEFTVIVYMIVRIAWSLFWKLTILKNMVLKNNNSWRKHYKWVSIFLCFFLTHSFDKMSTAPIQIHKSYSCLPSQVARPSASWSVNLTPTYLGEKSWKARNLSFFAQDVKSKLSVNYKKHNSFRCLKKYLLCSVCIDSVTVSLFVVFFISDLTNQSGTIVRRAGLSTCVSF